MTSLSEDETPDLESDKEREDEDGDDSFNIEEIENMVKDANQQLDCLSDKRSKEKPTKDTGRKEKPTKDIGRKATPAVDVSTGIRKSRRVQLQKKAVLVEEESPEVSAQVTTVDRNPVGKNVISLKLLSDSADERRAIRSAIVRYRLEDVEVGHQISAMKRLLKVILGEDYYQTTKSKYPDVYVRINHRELLYNSLPQHLSYRREPPFLQEIPEDDGPWREMLDWLELVGDSSEITDDIRALRPIRESEAVTENVIKFLMMKFIRNYPEETQDQLSVRL